MDYTPFSLPKASGISKFAEWRKHWPEHPQTLENRSDLNSNVNERAQRSRAFPCAAKMAAFPVNALRTALTGTTAFQAAALPATGPCLPMRRQDGGVPSQ